MQALYAAKAAEHTHLFKPIQSPFNYTGSKFKLLPQILPFFPKKIDCFVDLFCGGCVVGVNAKNHYKRLICNDILEPLIKLLEIFKANSLDSLQCQIHSIIQSYSLSESAKNGYAFYSCDSSKGLSSYNKEGFARLRDEYNRTKDSLLLFVLLVFSFNNQLRFNAKGEFNLPCGKRDFNKNMQNKLKVFVSALQSLDVEFRSRDFRGFCIDSLDSKDFVYIDPPYLLSVATYNENGGWGSEDELQLYDFMERLHSQGIAFAFSNVLHHKGRDHILLRQWLDKTGFKVHFLDFSYKNCNYQTKRGKSSEVLITNY